MSTGITVIAITIGVILIVMVAVSMQKKQISDYQGIMWLALAVLVIILGAFPRLVNVFARLLGIWWAPSVLLFANAVLMGFILFNHSKEISILKAQVTELAIQVSIMKAEKLKENEAETAEIEDKAD